MDNFENTFSKLKHALLDNNTETIRKMMQESTIRRADFDKSSPTKK